MQSFHISYVTIQQIVAPDTMTKITRYEMNGMRNEEKDSLLLRAAESCPENSSLSLYQRCYNMMAKKLPGTS